MDEYRKYLSNKYHEFSQILFHFLDEGYLESSKRDDLRVVKTFCNKFDGEDLIQVIKEGKELLQLKPFPWEWMEDISNYYCPFNDQKLSDEDGFKKWVAWIIETIEQEAIKYNKFDKKVIEKEKNFNDKWGKIPALERREDLFWADYINFKEFLFFLSSYSFLNLGTRLNKKDYLIPLKQFAKEKSFENINQVLKEGKLLLNKKGTILYQKLDEILCCLFEAMGLEQNEKSYLLYVGAFLNDLEKEAKMIHTKNPAESNKNKAGKTTNSE